jgi:hypothetical protein
MATDGVKIIDSDWAHDIYSTFMDMYDLGLSIDAIKNEVEKLGENSVDDFEYEIYFTTYCLALWEIGELDKSKFDELIKVVSKEACAKYYKTELNDSFFFKARLKEISKLITKLSNQNSKIRKRKKHKLVTKFHYNPGDVLAFKGSDNLFHFTYLLFITQYRGECVYHFIPIIFESEDLVPVEEVLKNKIAGRKIFSTLEPEGYKYGLDSSGVIHKDLFDYKNNFTVIGNFQVLEKYRRLGSQGSSRNWQEFSKWHEQIKLNIKASNMSPFEIQHIIL